MPACACRSMQTSAASGRRPMPISCCAIPAWRRRMCGSSSSCRACASKRPAPTSGSVPTCSRVAMPAEIILGEAQICVSRSPRSGGVLAGGISRLSASTGVRRAIAAGTFIVSLVTLSVIAFGLPHRSGERPVGAALGSRVPAAPPGETASLDEAMRELNDRLDRALLRSLRVGMLDGSITVTGRLAPREADAWKTIERWFDQTYGGRLVLAAKVTVSEGRTLPPPQLQAIWFGVRPYIITVDGSRHEPGSALDNGWVVSEIGKGRLVLARDGETVALTYP